MLLIIDSFASQLVAAGLDVVASGNDRSHGLLIKTPPLSLVVRDTEPPRIGGFLFYLSSSHTNTHWGT